MKNLQEEVEKKQLSVRAYNVIYKLVDDIKKEINNRLPLVDVEKVIGMYIQGEGREKESRERTRVTS